MNKKTDGARTMDTGKILMGTALVLLMIGLVVHPANAAQTGCIYPVQQNIDIGDSGQIPTGCNVFCDPGAGSSVPATHSYKRFIISTCASLIPDDPKITG
jgi:hypothetical protein